MNDFLKMDIFFLITTVAVVLLTLFGVLVLWRCSRVLTHLEHILEQVARESDSVRLDLANLRADIRRGKGRLKSVLGFFERKAKRASKST